MKILVIGAGATGGYLGARLTAAGRDVTFLVREHRATQIRAHGLQIIAPTGDLTVHPKLLLASELHEPFDLILITVKAYQLDAAMDDLAPAVDPATVILPFLNGMAHLDKLIARFGDAAVLGGSVRIPADLDDQGRIHLMDPLHDIVFGERDRSVTPRIQAIAQQFSGVGVADQLSPDIIAYMWQKWTMLASLGAITCMMRGSIGEVASVQGGPETAASIHDEALAISAANGYPQPTKVIETFRTYLTDTSSKLTASMQRDMLKGAPVEADHILGDLLARANNTPAPLLRAAYAQLTIYAKFLTTQPPRP